MSYRKLSTTELHEAETHMTLGRKNVLLISGLHANGSVQPDHLAVDHWVLRQGRHQVGKLSGVSQAGGKGTWRARKERTFSGRPAKRGVENRPGRKTRENMFYNPRKCQFKISDLCD